jgi:hypothetical protein
MTVHHFRVLRKLALTDGHVRADRNRFEAQTLEEAEAQDRVAAEHLAYEHLLVVYLEDFDRKVFDEDHDDTRHLRPNAYKATCIFFMYSQRVRTCAAQRARARICTNYISRDVSAARLTNAALNVRT